MKRILALLLLAVILLPLASCGYGPDEPADGPGTESAETDPPETEPPVPEEPLFPDLFEAKRAVLRLEDLDLPMKLYTEESYARFQTTRDKVTEDLRKEDLTLEEAEKLYKRLSAARDLLKVVRGDTPRVYIYKEDDVHHSYYTPCTCVVVSAADEKYKAVSDTNCEISYRGNSTSGGDKPPYNIRFSEQVSLLGMDRGRKWCLLANLYDKTLMRNYIAYRLAAQMGLPYTSGCRFVELYYNGEYRGSYTLLEPVTDGRGRVEIDTERLDFIFEVDMNRNDGSYYVKPKLGQRMKVDKPDKVDSEGRAVLKDFFALMEEALKTHEMEQYGKYIDVDSFVNFYIHSEITKSIDVYDFSTRYFMKDGILYAGPVWDYDLSMGNVSASCNEDKYFTYCNVRGFGTKSGDSAEGEWMDNYWFHELMEDPAFRERVIARYEEVFPLIENLYQDNSEGPCLIDWITERYGASFRRNYDEAGWKEMRRYSGLAKDETLPFEEEVAWLKDWFRRRAEWVSLMILDKCG